MFGGELSRCGRCGRRLKNIREAQRHNRQPCDQDNVLARRARAEAERNSPIPRRPIRRGRKNMMRPNA